MTAPWRHNALSQVYFNNKTFRILIMKPTYGPLLKKSESLITAITAKAAVEPFNRIIVNRINYTSDP